jgi:hypothetical protein
MLDTTSNVTSNVTIDVLHIQLHMVFLRQLLLKEQTPLEGYAYRRVKFDKACTHSLCDAICMLLSLMTY